MSRYSKNQDCLIFLRPLDFERSQRSTRLILWLVTSGTHEGFHNKQILAEEQTFIDDIGITNTNTK